MNAPPSSSPTFSVHGPAEASVPLLVTVPHAGTDVPDGLAERWTPDAHLLADTDWHLGQLYDFVPRLGARMMVARYSRYVVDLNRPADGAPLYPGRNETGLLPTSTFADQPLYRPGLGPDEAERQARVERYWRPWHAAVRAELDALKARFGYAILFDAHSITGEVPRFFAGTLPDLMLGTADGRSCHPALAAAAGQALAESPYSWVVNGTFKGGFITRAFGQPHDYVHALQLEMSQRIYMEEGTTTFAYLPERAQRLQPWLERLLRALLDTPVPA